MTIASAVIDQIVERINAGFDHNPAAPFSGRPDDSQIIVRAVGLQPPEQQAIRDPVLRLDLQLEVITINSSSSATIQAAVLDMHEKAMRQLIGFVPALAHDLQIESYQQLDIETGTNPVGSLANVYSAAIYLSAVQ